MACSEGLASNIEQALDMVPIQMIRCVEARQRVTNGNQSPLSGRPVGTAEDFVAMAGMASGGQGWDVSRG